MDATAPPMAAARSWAGGLRVALSDAAASPSAAASSVVPRTPPTSPVPSLTAARSLAVLRSGPPSAPGGLAKTGGATETRLGSPAEERPCLAAKIAAAQMKVAAATASVRAELAKLAAGSDGSVVGIAATAAPSYGGGRSGRGVGWWPSPSKVQGMLVAQHEAAAATTEVLEDMGTLVAAMQEPAGGAAATAAPLDDGCRVGGGGVRRAASAELASSILPLRQRRRREPELGNVSGGRAPRWLPSDAGNSITASTQGCPAASATSGAGSRSGARRGSPASERGAARSG